MRHLLKSLQARRIVTGEGVVESQLGSGHAPWNLPTFWHHLCAVRFNLTASMQSAQLASTLTLLPQPTMGP